MSKENYDNVETTSKVNLLNSDLEQGYLGHGRKTSNMSLVNQSQIKIVCQDLQFSVIQRRRENSKRPSLGWCSKNQKQQKTIINGVTAAFRPGRLTAVMGASGAGKTSLLSLLAGET
jgi:ABC-type transport system involved in cytochrome bd biosynthesis fused ATPase/permease subunit